jgi:hypothetical protein
MLMPGWTSRTRGFRLRTKGLTASSAF